MKYVDSNINQWYISINNNNNNNNDDKAISIRRQ